MIFKMDKQIKKHILIAWLITVVMITGDMITTIIGLSLGAKEVNPVSAFLFSIFGQVITWIVQVIFVFIALVLLYKLCVFVYEKIEKKKMSKRFKIFIPYFAAVVFAVLELFVIINNIKVIYGLGS